MRPPSLIHDFNLEVLRDLAAGTPAEGCFVEVGVYKGGSAWELMHVAHGQGRALHLFDTFEGIPERSAIDHHQVGDFDDTDLFGVMEALGHLGSKVCAFHVGVFPDTLPPDLGPVAFAHIDVDQYRSTAACIDRLWPLIVPGGVMLFDDFGCLDGATKAVTERFGKKHGTPYELTAAGRAWVRKERA